MLRGPIGCWNWLACPMTWPSSSRRQCDTGSIWICCGTGSARERSSGCRKILARGRCRIIAPGASTRCLPTITTRCSRRWPVGRSRPPQSDFHCNGPTIMAERTLRGKTAIAGIGETIYYKHGQSPDSEFKLALEAIVKACADAGISPHDIDGFASYGNDRSDGPRLAAALGIKELRYSNMFWGGGGGGVCGAVGNASAAVATGMADCVIAFRSLAQGQYARYGRGNASGAVGGDDAFLFPYGVMSPAQRFAMKVTRFMHEHGIKQEALRAISIACYHHAQNNPNAVMRGRTLDEAKYDASRWIIEPFFHLYDCCQENDGAAAVIVVPAERAEDSRHKPSYLLACGQGCDHRSAAPVHNMPNYPSSHFSQIAPRLYE